MAARASSARAEAVAERERAREVVKVVTCGTTQEQTLASHHLITLLLANSVGNFLCLQYGGVVHATKAQQTIPLHTPKGRAALGGNRTQHTAVLAERSTNSATRAPQLEGDRIFIDS